MAFSLPGRTRAVSLLCTLAAASLAACEIPPDLIDDDDKNTVPPLWSPDGGRPPNASGIVPPGSPAAGVDAGPGTPANWPEAGQPMGAAGCKMWERGNEVCVICQDASGKVVRDSCYTKEPPPPGDDCHEVRRADGSLCTVCF